ncbi:MAG: hypothetical protein ACR5K5_01780 [Wolbachia sp.]
MSAKEVGKNQKVTLAEKMEKKLVFFTKSTVPIKRGLFYSEYKTIVNFFVISK